MATREAAIKLVLSDAAFQSGLRALVGDVDQAGKKMGKSVSGPLDKGLSSLKRGIGNVGSQISGVARTAVTLGGALSFGALIKSAVTMSNTYRNIAFQINKVAGNSVKWQDVHELIDKASDDTGQSEEALAQTFRDVFAETGNFALAASSIHAIGEAANASGEDVANLGVAVQLSARKFGIGPDMAAEAMTRFIEKTGVGGKGLDELTRRFGTMATEAHAAGFAGVDGISQLLGLMNVLDKSIGERADPALNNLFRTMKDGSASMKKLRADAGVAFKPGATALDKVRELLKTARGRKAARMTFTADARVAFDEMAKPFEEAFAASKTRGDNLQKQTVAGLAEFDRVIGESGKSTMKFADVQGEAARRAKEDPMVAFRIALEKATDAFGSAQFLGSLSKLSESLPALAEGIGKVVEFVANHPALAVGGALGAQAVAPAAAGLAGAGLAAAGKAVGKKALEAGTTSALGEAVGGTAVAGGALAGAAALATFGTFFMGTRKLLESTGWDKAIENWAAGGEAYEKATTRGLGGPSPTSAAAPSTTIEADKVAASDRGRVADEKAAAAADMLARSLERAARVAGGGAAPGAPGTTRGPLPPAPAMPGHAGVGG